MPRPGSWLKNLFAQESKEEVTTNELTPRINRAVESILENESLTADLDDAAAKVLLDWGIACANMIARSTASLNDIEVEDIMSPRMRATRRLMRLVNRRVSRQSHTDAGGGTTLLTKVIEQATIIYGTDFTPPDNEQRNAFLQEGLISSSPQFIMNLRALIENQVATRTSLEETDDQEKY
jgi:hypothetical protein